MFRTSIGFVALILLLEASFGNCVSFENSPLSQEFDAESNIVIARSSEDGTSNVERINENEADREDEIPNSDLFESKTEEYLVTLPSITGETPTINLNVTYDATEYNGTSNDTSDVQGTISGNAVSSTMEQTTTDFSITETTSPCEPNPCLNSGNCTEVLMIDYNCSCEADYIGQHCETRDYCTTNGESGLCKNGACVYGPNKRYRFCKCFSGDYWDTVTQECKNEERPCWPNPCKFGGNCTIVSPDNYKCICKESYSGQRCEIQDMCETNREGIKCENGECKFDKKNNLKYCKCNENFYLDGKTKSCKRNKPPCEPNPCKYGHCNILSEGSFNCTCDDYYIGNRCDILNYCFPDKEGNICKNGFCKLSGTTQYCVCSVGYYMDEETDACKPVSPPCAPNPCMNDGICTPISQKDFNCSCADGYIGSRCHIRSWCKLDGGKEFCAPSSCLTDHTSNADYCSCPEGEYFDYRTRKCSVIDLCPLMVCEKTEICSDNMCKCKDNYKRNNQSGICEPNYCEIKKCPSDDMICEENLNGYPEEYSCFCKEGYAFNGTSCNYVVCALPVLNLCSQLCQPEADGYLCACNEYFKLKEDNTTCEYTGNEECSNKTCGKGSCMKKDGEEICICAPGYIEQNGKCIDQCTADKLPVGICPYNKCEPIFEKEFRCVCEGKYALSNNGITCTKRNLCSQNEAGWKYCQERAAICEEEWNSFQGFKCICPKGFVKIEGVCKDLCDIKDNQRYCYFKGGICDVDENYHLSCRCPPSFVKDEITGSCNKIADYSYLVKLPLELNAYRKPSRKTGRIDKNIRTLRSVVPSEIDYHKIKTDIFESLGRLYENFQHANILSCTGLQDFSTCIVELQFKEYTWEKLYRLKIGSLCSFNTTLSNRDCLIPPSLVLRRDKIESEVVFNITDQCNEAVKPNLCSQYTKCYSNALHKYFSCTCKSGFNIKERKYLLSNSDSVIEICEDFNECESSVPCPVTTVCINTIGSYKCLCKPGYRLTNYTLDPKRDGCVELCNPNPCIKGECKSTGLHTFECRCQAGFAGALCDVQDKNYKDATMNTIIVGAVLGGVLLLTIVIFISTVSRLRKKNFGIENSQIIAESSEMAESRPVRTGVNNRGYQRD